MSAEAKAIATVPPRDAAFTNEQIDLITRTVAKGANKDELALFLHAARRTGLDPLMKQIHAVKRWDREQQREVMAIQTGIDGLRLVAERTGKYAPGREPSFTYTETGGLISATAYVKKMTADGTWHEIAATAHYNEYAQKKKDGQVTSFWARMPHVMLAKCAEAIALRRAFPMELSGIYAQEEMTQAGDPSAEPETPAVQALITDEQRADVDALIEETGTEASAFCEFFHIKTVGDLPAEEYGRAIRSLETKLKKQKGKA